MAVSHAVPQNAPEKRVAAQGASGALGEDAKSKNKSADPPSLVTGYLQAPTASDEKESNTEQESLNIQRKLEWFTGVLAGVGVLQVAAMIWQAFLLKGTMKEMSIQAGLMKGSLALSVQKEKPVLLMEQEVEGKEFVSFHVANRGQTPVRIGTSFVQHAIYESIGDFPEIPPYNYIGKPKILSLLLPGDREFVDAASIPHAEGTQTVWFFGVVRWSARLEMCQWRRETLDKESIWDEERSTSLSRW
jgi:hypothetical protein